MLIVEIAEVALLVGLEHGAVRPQEAEEKLPLRVPLADRPLSKHYAHQLQASS